MDAKTLQVEFTNLEKGPGILDVAVRVDTETGEFEFCLEENGLPTTVPFILLAGSLQMVLNNAMKQYYEGAGD